MLRTSSCMFFTTIFCVFFTSFAIAGEIRTAKIYRDYPAYIEPPSCINPRMAPSYLQQPAEESSLTTSPVLEPTAGHKDSNVPQTSSAGHLYGGVWAGMFSQASDDVNKGSIDADFDYDYGYGGALLIGYDFGAIRFDLEGSYRTADIDKVDINGNEVASVDGELENRVVMLNGYYDFMTGGDFSPYVGGGLGLAKVSANNAEGNNIQIKDDSDTVLAGQLSAGILFALNQSLALDIGYRFLITEKPEFSTAVGKVDMRNISHAVIVGLQVNF